MKKAAAAARANEHAKGAKEGVAKGEVRGDSEQAEQPNSRLARLPPAIALCVFLALILAFAFATPFLLGAQNLIGLLIIAFGLYEAWKINKRPHLDIQGPFSVAPAGAKA
jgi:hypothetical protein